MPAPDEPELSPGDTLGDYRIEAVLGAGAFGTVYRATHSVIGKLAAVKVLNRAFASDSTMYARFVGEARAVNAISHPNIVDIFGFGQTSDGRHFIVMELLRGETLTDVLAIRRTLPFEESLSILRPLSAALGAAHARGITHRDLKPDNVFLHLPSDRASPVIKLLDFGIARLPPSSVDAAPLTRAGWVVGTPGYMSPEQTVGEPVDGRADVFAFGVLAFRMLAGRLPFEGDSLKDLLAAQLHGPPPSLSVFAPELPRHLDDAFRWLLHKDAPLRCPDMHRAIAALEGTGAIPPEALRAPSLSAATVNVRAPAFGPDTVRDEVLAAVAATNATVDSSVNGAPDLVAMPALLREADAARRRSPALVVAGALGLAGLLAFGWVELSHRPEPSAAASEPAPATPEPLIPEDLRFVSVEGAPEGAGIFAPDGAQLGTVPAVLELPRARLPLVLELRKEGFVPRTFRIAADVPARSAVKVSLVPRRSTPLVPRSQSR